VTNVEGRVALVTGASSGIGRASALLLAERGARVMATGRDEARLREVAEQIGAEHMVAELETPEGCADLVARTNERLGPVEVLVCSAGRGSDPDKVIWDQTWEDWRQTMAINLDAPFLLSKLCAGQMRDAGWGRIVIVSSTAGQLGAPAMSAYCASKHAVIGLMRSVAHDVGAFGGTCNAVLPGWVRTIMADVWVQREADERGISIDEMWKVHDAEYPRGRILEADEVARVIAWLASDDASGVNGEALTVALGGLW
jgi:NAD(P)-dependent dehydrogenase (short-subunit alcohol dehydrogenase family)